MLRLTDRTANGNHLHVTTLELPRQPRVRSRTSSSFMIKPLGHSSFAAFGDSSVWITPEAIYESLLPWVAVARGASNVDVSSVRLTAAHGLFGIMILHIGGAMTSSICLCGAY